MKRTDLIIILFIAAIGMLTACHSDDEEKKDESPARQTILMYFPWADDTKMYSACQKNITAMKTAVEYNRGLNGKKLLALVAETANRAVLIDIKYENGKCKNDTVKRYSSLQPTNFTSTEGLTSFFKDAKTVAPATKYALTIGCHGMGWLPVEGGTQSARAKQQSPTPSTMRPDGIYIDEDIDTRYFGSLKKSPQFQTEISTLKTALANAFGHLDFLVFDDCYMQDIEVAYELKDVTDYIIASTCEVMMEGIPYATVGKDLLEDNYGGVVDGFYSFYNSYRYPYGTLSVLKTSELENTARLMKTINSLHSFDTSKMSQVQTFDLEEKSVFMDMGSYVRLLCQDDQNQYNQITEQMNRLIPNKAHTDYGYVAKFKSSFKIEEFSGVSISDPSLSADASSKETTSWWKATH